MNLTLEQKYLVRLVLLAALVLGGAFLGSQIWYVLASLVHRLDVLLGLAL